MKKLVVRVITLLIVIASCFSYHGAASALGERSNTNGNSITCKESGATVHAESGTIQPTPSPGQETNSAAQETVFVELRDGVTIFFDETFAPKFWITPDLEKSEGNGFSGIISATQPDQGNSTNEKSEAVTIRCDESSGKLIDKALINGKETVLIHVSIERLDNKKNTVMDVGYIELGRVSNIEAVLMKITDWEQIQNNVDFKSQYEEITNTLGQQQSGIQNISTVSSAVDQLKNQLDDARKLDLMKLIAIGASILMTAALLVVLIVRTKAKKVEPIAEDKTHETQNQKIEETLDVARGIARHQPEISQCLSMLDGRITELSNKVNGASVFKPKEDATSDFLALVNGCTTITSIDQWTEDLKKYQPELMKFDAIQNWFTRGGTFGEPPFAACAIRHYEGLSFYLIPSCYDTMLASGDMQVAYDVVYPINGERARSYKIDRAAMLEIFGAYYRVVSRGQISLV
ncbi:MAG TPA: hypothetical protein VN631_02585, partial [Negativicutes bacterium]|nr:hypothetical protein [Negativicutes bacterium]